MTDASLWEPLRAANIANRRLLQENVDLKNEVARLKAKIAGLEGRLAGIREAACMTTVSKFEWKPSTDAETPVG